MLNLGWVHSGESGASGGLVHQGAWCIRGSARVFLLTARAALGAYMRMSSEGFDNTQVKID